MQSELSSHYPARPRDPQPRARCRQTWVTPSRHCRELGCQPHFINRIRGLLTLRARKDLSTHHIQCPTCAGSPLTCGCPPPSEALCSIASPPAPRALPLWTLDLAADSSEPLCCGSVSPWGWVLHRVIFHGAGLCRAFSVSVPACSTLLMTAHFPSSIATAKAPPHIRGRHHSWLRTTALERQSLEDLLLPSTPCSWFD